MKEYMTLSAFKQTAEKHYRQLAHVIVQSELDKAKAETVKMVTDEGKRARLSEAFKRAKERVFKEVGTHAMAGGVKVLVSLQSGVPVYIEDVKFAMNWDEGEVDELIKFGKLELTVQGGMGKPPDYSINGLFLFSSRENVHYFGRDSGRGWIVVEATQSLDGKWHSAMYYFDYHHPISRDVYGGEVVAAVNSLREIHGMDVD